MFTKEMLLQNYDWAVESFDILFEHCRGFSNEQLLQEHAGFGYPSLWDQLAHILSCENYWLYNITGSLAVSDWHSERTLGGLLQRRPALIAASRDYISSADDQALNTDRTF